MRNGNRPAAVLFDMDGVLVDSEPLHGRCFIAAFEEFGVNSTPESYRQAVTLAGSTVKVFYTSLGGDPATWEAVKAAKDRLMAAAVRTECEMRPGVLDLLRSLKSAGIPTALATAARRISTDIILDRFDLRSYFDKSVVKQDVRAEKPDPECFLLAARRLGVPPEDCAVIEDSPRGVLAANRAGMKCIAVPTRSTADGDFTLATAIAASPADITIDKLRDLFRE